jgi:hypothetical protein
LLPSATSEHKDALSVEIFCWYSMFVLLGCS